jgi:hypothetical protein
MNEYNGLMNEHMIIVVLIECLLLNLEIDFQSLLLLTTK